MTGKLATSQEGQKLYRQADRSVSALAARTGVPEYVLRRLIHDRLVDPHSANGMV